MTIEQERLRPSGKDIDILLKKGNEVVAKDTKDMTFIK
jgi:hypothetical protein